MPRFAAGVVRFQQEVYPERQAFFEKLSKSQSPEALFITCSDSRIETAMLTQTEPGDLFVCRNAGNIVPPHSSQTGGITASIEFAVSALKVSHIVVCGHTDCGAMKGALNLDKLGGLPHVREWLGHSRAAVEIVEAIGGDLNEHDKLLMLLEQNVLLQLQHLRTHPSVAVRLAMGDITLHGWVYDIAEGEVLAVDLATGKWSPVSNRYADAFAKAAAATEHEHEHSHA